MKLVRCNGHQLTVYDLGEPLMVICTRPDGPPIKHNGTAILEDEAARDILKDLLRSGHYEKVKP